MSAFIPLLDYIIEDLIARLPEETWTVFDLQIYIPKVLVEKYINQPESIASVSNIASRYCNIFKWDKVILESKLQGELHV